MSGSAVDWPRILTPTPWAHTVARVPDSSGPPLHKREASNSSDRRSPSMLAQLSAEIADTIRQYCEGWQKQDVDAGMVRRPCLFVRASPHWTVR